MNSKLSISKLDILGEVFQKHHWPIDHDKQKSYFNKYVRMLESMSEDEQNMMLELTDNFCTLNNVNTLQYYLRLFVV